jgi:hypothetical protein
MSDERKACRGGDARTCRVLGASAEFVECRECKRAVRWDMADHPLFGFQTCDKAEPTAPAGDPQDPRRR